MSRNKFYSQKSENTRVKKNYSLIAHPILLPSVYYLTVEHKSRSPSSIVFAFDPISDYKTLFPPIKGVNFVS